MSGWFGGKTDAKADEAAKTGPSVQDRAIEAKDQTISFIGEKSEAVTKAASDTADAAMKMGGDAMGKASETGQAITDRAIESKDQTFGFFGEKTEAAKKMAVDTGDAAKQKSAEAAKCVEETAAKFTGEPAAPKEGPASVSSFLPQVAAWPRPPKMVTAAENSEGPKHRRTLLTMSP